MTRPIYAKILIFAAAAGGLWLGIRWFLPIFLPFLLAAFLALAAETPVAWMHNKLHLPRPLAAGIGVGGVFLLLATLAVLLLAGLLRQLPRLSALAPQLEQAVLSGRELLRQWLLSLAGRLPGSIGQVATGWTESLFSSTERLAEPFLQKLPGLITGTVGKMSQGIFGILTGVMASFMLSVRLPQLRQWARNVLPPALTQRWQQVTGSLRRALGGWLLAQLKLAAITFAVLLTGFWILGVDHGPLWAALTTLVDAFPILGVGTVLVPWSLVCLLQGSYPMGVGLLAVYAVAWLLRSVLEPRLVGRGLGLDPLLTLCVMYAGFQLWGIPGLLLAPFVSMVAVQAWKVLRPRE